MKKILIVLGIIVVVLVVAALAKNSIIASAVSSGVHAATGLTLKIGSINVGVLRPIVHIKNLRLENPAGFADRTMADLPEIYVNYDLPSIMSGANHLREARLDLKEFVVIKNQKGELNLDSLQVVREQKQRSAPAPAPKIKIDTLDLKIGKAVYKDYSGGGAPKVMEFPVNLDQRFTNVESYDDIVKLIIVKALMNTTIGQLTNFALGGLEGSISGVLGSAQNITAVAGNVQAVAGQAAQTAKQATQAAKQATEAAKQATDAVSDVFKNPFGK
jgi:outer membrane lipoprotein SlyB